MWLRFLASGSRCLVKWSAPRSVNLASSLASRCQMMTRIERPTATMAFVTSPFGDAPIPGTEEGIGSAGHHGGLAEDAGQVAVAVAGGAVALGFAGGGVESG